MVKCRCVCRAGWRPGNTARCTRPCPQSRGEPAGFAGGVPSREGLGTLSGFPSQSRGEPAGSPYGGFGTDAPACPPRARSTYARAAGRSESVAGALATNNSHALTVRGVKLGSKCDRIS